GRWPACFAASRPCRPCAAFRLRRAPRTSTLVAGREILRARCRKVLRRARVRQRTARRRREKRKRAWESSGRRVVGLLCTTEKAARTHRNPKQRAAASHIERPLVGAAEPQVLAAPSNAPDGNDPEVLPGRAEDFDARIRQRIQ